MDPISWIGPFGDPCHYPSTSFSMIQNLMCCPSYHLVVPPHFFLSTGTDRTTFFQDQFSRITIHNDHDHSPHHPRFILLRLVYRDLQLQLTPHDGNLDLEDWILRGGSIQDPSSTLYLGIKEGRLGLFPEQEASWSLTSDFHLYHTSSQQFITFDLSYHPLRLTDKVEHAREFRLDQKGQILFVKPKLLVAMEERDARHGRLPLPWRPHHDHEDKTKNKRAAGVLLAAGQSTRFGGPVPKQLFLLQGIPVFRHSLLAMIEEVEVLVIVTNPSCHSAVQQWIGEDKGKKIHLCTVPPNQTRHDSLLKGLNHLESSSHVFHRIVVHDAACPYVTPSLFRDLIESGLPHDQVFFPLVHGLVKHGREMRNRDDYFEISTPFVMDSSLMIQIKNRYMSETSPLDTEWIPFLRLLRIPCHFREKRRHQLAKITFSEDASSSSS